MNFKNLTNKEITIISIVLGVIVALILGYTFGEVQYITPRGYRLKEPNDSTNEVFKINYLLFCCGFIISGGLSYLFLTRKINK